MRVDPARDEEHVVGTCGYVLSEQAVMVRDAVAKALEQTHPLGQVSADYGSVRERAAESVPPELFVGLAEETGPEAERDAGDDPTSCDRLASVEAFDGDDDLLDAVRLEDSEIHQPGVADRVLRLAVTEHGVDRVAYEHLEVVNHAEARCGELGVPVVERERLFAVAGGLIQERLEARS